MTHEEMAKIEVAEREKAAKRAEAYGAMFPFGSPIRVTADNIALMIRFGEPEPANQ